LEALYRHDRLRGSFKNNFGGGGSVSIVLIERKVLSQNFEAM